MVPPKVVIADAGEDFPRELERLLGETCQVRICGNGKAAMELVRSWRADVLVVDMGLRDMDGMTLLKTLRRSAPLPSTLVLTTLVSEFIQLTLTELGVQHILYKPCRMGLVKDLVAQMIRDIEETGEDPPALADMLRELGICSGRRGYRQMLVLIPLLARNRDMRLSKELYQTVVELDGSSPDQVDKNLRDAITAAWKDRDESVWRKYFLHGAGGEVAKPKNKEFLCRMADALNECRMPKRRTD